MPQGLVRVDVPEAGDRALVEDCRLERRAPAGEASGEECSREAAAERLGAVLHLEQVLGVLRLGEQPRAEAARVAIRDAAPVLELEDGALMRRRRVPEAAGHTQVHEQRVPALEPHDDVLPAAIDGRNAIAAEHPGDELRVFRSRQPRVVDSHGGDALSLHDRCQPAALGLDFGKLRQWCRARSECSAAPSRR